MDVEKIDSDLEQRVWQRVRGDERPMSLTALAGEELGGAAAFGRMLRWAHGRDQELLQQMIREDRAHAAGLKGIHKTVTGDGMNLWTLPPAVDPPQIALRKLYGIKRKLWAEYEGRSEDPEFGRVYARLARQEAEHLGMIMEILGRLEKISI